MPNGTVRNIASIFGFILSMLLVVDAAADTFKLNNGETLTGELLVTSANDAGVQVKVGDAKYERVSWSNFSQDDLKQFRDNKKLEPLVEPFIEVSIQEKVQKTEVPIKQPPRLERPAKQSLVGALFGSALGVFVLLMLYAGNLYAAYEIWLFRGHPLPLLMGVSAVVPVIGPIIFLSIPTKLKPTEAPEESPAETAAAAAAASADGALNPMQDTTAAHPTSLHLSHTEPQKTAVPETQIFQRGQFTFNRRFIETKFAAFFGVVRRDADKDLQLVVKTMRGNYVATRISRIAGNDMHLEVHHGSASQEVTVNFQEIQEVQIKHKDAK